jgi:hypothetical protein
MENLPANSDAFKQLMSLEKIEPHHLDHLDPETRAHFIEFLYEKLNTLKDEERDDFFEKSKALLDREMIWDYNHALITETIRNFVGKHGTLPNKARIAADCGLSRKTIRKHLQSFDMHTVYGDQKKVIDIMRQTILGSVMQAAVNGDMKAARLYLETVETTSVGKVVVNEQNNYVQINKTVINQQVIQQLSPQQLAQIEQIIAGQTEQKQQD